MGINIERLMANIEQMGRIGRSDLGGQTRVAFTPTYLKGEEFVLGLMQEAELTVRKDGLGNFFWMDERSSRFTGDHGWLPYRLSA